MGYQIQPNAPQITVQGRTFGIGSWAQNNPDGVYCMTGIYEMQADKTWWPVFNAADYYLNAGEYLAAIKAKGGGVKYVQWIVAQINAFFANMFATTTVPASEPTTDAEALAYVTASLNALTLTLVNGVPVLA